MRRQSGYRYTGHFPNLPDVDLSGRGLWAICEVEMQWFTRRPGTTVVVGVDKALAMIRDCAGYLEGDQFVETWDKLEVEAVHDGATVTYNGDPLNASSRSPRARTLSRLCLLETPTLGVS